MSILWPFLFSLLFDAYGVKKGILPNNCLVVNFSCFVNFLQKNLGKGDFFSKNWSPQTKCTRNMLEPCLQIAITDRVLQTWLFADKVLAHYP